MSEYWVSKKKYFCKYCDIYITDDAPSKRQHENGLRHQGNKERFVKGLYKAGEKRKKDLEEEKRDMARVERAAQAAFAQDVAAGYAKSSSAPVASTSSAPARKPPPPKPSNPYTNYSTAESLGYGDPDAERLKAEVERRRLMGSVGEWEIVSPAQNSEKEPLPVEGELSVEGAGLETNLKRSADVAVVDEEDTRLFKLRRKNWGAGLGDIYDPGIIPIKTKNQNEVAKEVKPEEDLKEGMQSTTGLTGGGGEGGWVNDVPLEASVSFPHEGGVTAAKPSSSVEVRPESVKKEEDTTTTTIPAAPGGNLFRKRKAPVGGGNIGRRQF